MSTKEQEEAASRAAAAAVLGLSLGTRSRLVFGAGFSSERVLLLEVSEAQLSEILAEGVVVKGAPEEEAVLCTSSRTFLLKQVETSNSLLLVPGAAAPREGEAAAGGASRARSLSRSRHPLRAALPPC